MELNFSSHFCARHVVALESLSVHLVINPVNVTLTMTFAAICASQHRRNLHFVPSYLFTIDATVKNHLLTLICSFCAPGSLGYCCNMSIK